MYVAKHQKNVMQHSGVKNVARSRMLQKSHRPIERSISTEEIPKEAFLYDPQVCLFMTYFPWIPCSLLL